MSLSIGRMKAPGGAFTAALTFLAGREPFSRLALADVVDPVAGAIKRGHYVLVSEEGRIVGFTCWALTTAETARRWAAGEVAPSYEECLDGDTVVLQMGGGSSRVVALQGVRHIARLYPGRPYVMVRYGRSGTNTGRFPDLGPRSSKASGSDSPHADTPAED